MKITIYTTNTCAYCAMVKRYFDSKKTPYEVVNLDDHPERQDEAYRLSGAFTVPITHAVSDNGAQFVTIGWKPGELAGYVL